MMLQLKYAVLIDAAFLKKRLKTLDHPVTSQRVVEFVEKIKQRAELRGARLYRVYYYDATPYAGKTPKPLTGGKSGEVRQWDIVNFSTAPVYQSNIKILDELKRHPYFAVRLGEVRFRGWRVKAKKLNPNKTARTVRVTDADLLPNIQQKGVDMRIGLDIASLALKNHVDLIVLITGDSDFVPVLKFARKEGRQIILYTLGQSIPEEMYAHADVCVEARAEEIVQ